MVESKLRTYIGIAATAITENNDIMLEVYVPEFIPVKTGELSLSKARADSNDVLKRVGQSPNSSVFTKEDTNRTTVKSKVNNMGMDKDTVELNDVHKNIKVVNVITSETIECEYFGNLTNQDVPDIHVGEKVLVYNIAGTEKFYWTAIGRDDHIRQFEHYKIKIADKKLTIKDLDDDNTYLFEMDTRNGKIIRLQTSNSDGEKYRYYIKIDAVKSTMEFRDDSGNTLILESEKPRWFLTNRDQCWMELIGPDMNINVPNNMTTTVGNDYSLFVGGNRKIEVSGDTTHTFSGKLSVKVIKDYTLSVVGKWSITAKECVMSFIKWTATVGTLAFTAKKASIVDSDGKTLHPPG